MMIGGRVIQRAEAASRSAGNSHASMMSYRRRRATLRYRTVLTHRLPSFRATPHPGSGGVPRQIVPAPTARARSSQIPGPTTDRNSTSKRSRGSRSASSSICCSAPPGRRCPKRYPIRSGRRAPLMGRPSMHRATARRSPRPSPPCCRCAWPRAHRPSQGGSSQGLAPSRR